MIYHTVYERGCNVFTCNPFGDFARIGWCSSTAPYTRACCAFASTLCVHPARHIQSLLRPSKSLVAGSALLFNGLRVPFLAQLDPSPRATWSHSAQLETLIGVFCLHGLRRVFWRRSRAPPHTCVPPPSVGNPSRSAPIRVGLCSAFFILAFFLCESLAPPHQCSPPPSVGNPYISWRPVFVGHIYGVLFLAQIKRMPVWRMRALYWGAHQRFFKAMCIAYKVSRDVGLRDCVISSRSTQREVIGLGRQNYVAPPVPYI